MAKRCKVIEDEIAYRLVTTPPPGSPNRITSEELRTWVINWLAAEAEDLARFPELAGQPHWDLWMMDARLEDALFAVVIFRADGVEFFCGTGNAFAIKDFADDFANNPDEVLEEMKARFSIPRSSLRLDRTTAEQWFGRGW